MMKMWDVMKGVGFGANLLLVGAALSACATEGGATEGAANEPIAEVDLANGSRVTFFETAPGALAIAEETAAGVAPLDTTGKSAVELYRSIAPERPVPDALVAAQARSDEARRDRPLRELSPTPAKGSSASFTSFWFQNMFCMPGPGFLNSCYTGPMGGGVTGEIDTTRFDVDELTTTLCVNSGHVGLRIWVEGTLEMSVQRSANECFKITYMSGLFNAESIRIKTDILSEIANYFLAITWTH